VNNFFKAALAEAAKNIETGEGGPFGAVIVKENQIIGRGRNRVIASHDPTHHGEVAAIRDACVRLGTHDLSGCTLYTTCYPCPMCLAAAMWARIDTIIYGATAEDAAAIGFDDAVFYENFKTGKGFVFRQEEQNAAVKMMRQWSESDKKQLY